MLIGIKNLSEVSDTWVLDGAEPLISKSEMFSGPETSNL